MNKTRFSLFYLVGYLFPTGAGLLLAPRFTLKLMLASGEYGDILPRVVGMFLLGLFIIVTQMIRLRAEVMYPTTVIVRAFFCTCLTVLYFVSRDPMFLVMLGVVGLGLILTGTCCTMEWRRRAGAQ